MTRTRSAAAVRALLAQHDTLYDAAAQQAGARPVVGRGTAWAIELQDESWLVRHYRRGGHVARVLGDRYAAWAGNRALYELRISVEARARGVPTPEVVAAVCYSDGLFARFDIAVDYIADAHDLASLLFEVRIPSDDDVARATNLITTFIRCGLLHADLNLKNLLITPTAAYVVDLDRCQMVGEPTQAQATRMCKRFMRSLEKWESRTGRIIHDEHREALEAAFHV